MAMQLVEQWLTEAALFTADGENVIPSELLYKKPVLLERGSFRPLTNPMLDMMERALEMFVKEPALQGETPVTMFEMTLRQLQVGDAIDHRADFSPPLVPPPGGGGGGWGEFERSRRWASPC